MPNSARLVFLGDLMLGRSVSSSLNRHSPEWYWGDALPQLRAADAVIANLESPITTSLVRWTRGWKFYHFRADPAALEILTCANVRFVSLANNHILDFDERGLLDTIAFLDARGIRHAGAGRSRAEAARPAILDLPQLSLGILAATDNIPEFRATDTRPGTNLMTFSPASRDLDTIGRATAELRRAGTDIVLLSLHWGPNMRIAPSRKFRDFAHAAIDRGVDIIHGHSAHVFQAVESYRGGFILYDTGNFIDDYGKFPFRRDDWSFIFSVDIEDQRPRRLRMVPVHLQPAPVALATPDTADAIIRRMQSLCARHGSTPTRTTEGLELASQP